MTAAIADAGNAVAQALALSDRIAKLRTLVDEDDAPASDGLTSC